MKRIAFCLALSICLLGTGFFVQAGAQDRDQYNRDQAQYNQDQYNRGDRGEGVRNFTDHDRRALTEWYRDHADEMEPRGDRDRWSDEDIERDLQVDRPLDEGARRWARPLPDEIASRLDPLPRDWRYVMVGYNVAIVDRDWTVRDVFHFDQFSDNDRRAIRQWNQDHPDAVRQFLGNFGVRIDNSDLDRRLQVGNEVDPDLQSRAHPAPDDLVSRLTPTPRGWHYTIIGDRLLLVDRDWRIHESFHFQH